MLCAEKLTVASTNAPTNGALSLPGTVETVDYQGQAARYFLRLGHAAPGNQHDR
ncbi:TOBE domain-containing protein [Breoghania sp.]|uniref:TOBE domain-containing protein n=1 Tax=Breoghania sp. TaxID=2065378 RepID=UPI0026105A7F|nr:TOBE domain-containing protein [Breoghania sp.]MDJ0932672.1 TOBE domain-containing protein [Breoghania sp.]